MRKASFLVLLVMMAALAGATRPSSVATASPAVDPERIDQGSYMSVTEDYIYYSSEGNIELLCMNLQGEVYGRVPNGGGPGDEEQLLTNCDAAPFPESAMVSDGETTYFVGYVENFSLHALYERPADGSGPATQVTLDQHLAPRALAVDEEWVYFAVVESTSYIMRRHKQNNNTEVVAVLNDVAGGHINGMALDSDYVYWTEGEEGGMGRVRRAEKTGGAPILIADNLALPWDIETYLTSVFWTELDGQRVARRSKTGAGSTVPLVEVDRPVTALHIHEGVLYYGAGNAGTQNGGLWRTTGGGTDPVLMAFGFPPPRDIAWVDGWIYWVDSQLRRLPPDAETEGVDYGIDWFEVTQGVQDGDNTIPLVALKPTFVRVYARELSGSAGVEVRARLHGFRNGVPMPGSPLIPLQYGQQDLLPDLPLRQDEDRTYVFLLPASWTFIDGVQLQAEVNPGDQVYEDDYDNNLYPASPKAFDFFARIICLRTYPVAAADVNGDAVVFGNSNAVIDPRLDRATTLLSTIIWYYKEGAEVWNEDSEGAQIPHIVNSLGGWGALLNDVADLGELSDPPNGCMEDQMRYGGLVDIDADWNSAGLGFGGMGGDNRWAARWWESDPAGNPLDYNEPAGGFLWAHETGHTLGRPHVDCGGAGSPAYYPYPPCTNDDTGDEDESWGYDPITGSVTDPSGHKDLMAYGSTRWVSDFTWKCIFDFVGDIVGDGYSSGVQGCDWPLEGPLNRDAQVVNGQVMVINGAHTAPDEWTIRNLTDYPGAEYLTQAQLSLAEANPDSGAYEAVLLGPQGNEIVAKRFSLEVYEDYSGLPQRFSVALPHELAPARLEIRDYSDGKLLAARDVSNAPPKVELNSARFDPQGRLLIGVSAGDADGDDLQLVGQYVGPQGQKQALFQTRHWGDSQIECDPCDWPAPALPGGSGHVRVFVSDGMRTTMAEIALRVPDHAPEASINPSQHGVPDQAGYVTVLVWPSAWDAEDGPLGPESFSWLVNGQRYECDCVALPVTADMLADSRNGETTVDVALIVTDSDRQTTRVEVVVDLMPEPPPPPMYRLFLPVTLKSLAQ